MSDTYVLPNKQLSAALLSPVRMALTVLIVFALLLLAFWCVCLGLYFSSWARDLAPLVALFHAALGDMAPDQPFVHMAGLAQAITQWLHGTLFVATGLDSLQPGAANTLGPLQHASDVLMKQLVPSAQVVIVSTQVFGVRLATLAGMTPLVLLGYVVARTDGGAERVIRRACAGRESATLYHRAKYLQYGLLGALLLSALCLPIHVNPVALMLAFALCSTVLARLQSTYYKKYA